MTTYTRTILAVLLTVGIHQTIDAQTRHVDSLVSGIIADLSTYWKAQESLFIEDPVEPEMTPVHQVYTYPVDLVQMDLDKQKQVIELEADLKHRDYGVTGSGSYLENLSPSVSDISDNLVYRRRVQAGINWDILGGGLIENRTRETILRNEAKMLDFEKSEVQKGEEYLSRWHSIMYLFNQRKVKILDKRREVVEKQLDIAQQLYHIKYLTKEDLLKIQSRLAEVKSMYGIYQTYNDMLEPDSETQYLEDEFFPVIDINYEALFQKLNRAQNDSVLMLALENIELENKKLHDVRVRLFGRYNWYDIINLNNVNRNFFSVGVSASVPIPFNWKKKDEITAAKAELARFNARTSGEDIHTELLNDLYEFRYKLKQYVSFHEKKNRFLEQLRQERVKSKLRPENFNPVKALGLIDDILAIDIELMDLKQNLYLKMLRVYTKVPEADIRTLVRPFELPTHFEIDRITERSVYIWSEAFERFTPDFIQEYMSYNNLDIAVVAMKPDDSMRTQKKDLFAKIQGLGLKASIMSGYNKLIFEDDVSGYLGRLSRGLDTSLIDAIHLDVEPHTLDNWDQNTTVYMQQYITMLKKARTFCDSKGLELHVSVPLHYENQYMQSIFDLTDKVYFMAYENVKTSYLQRKLTGYLQQYPGKSVIASRTEDFADRKEMEAHFVVLRDLLNATGFAMHDLRELVDWDQKVLEREE